MLIHLFGFLFVCDNFLATVFGNKWQCHMHMFKVSKGKLTWMDKINCHLIARHVGYVSNKNGLDTWHTPSLSIALMISVNSPFIFSSKPHKSPIIRLSYI